MSAIGGEAKRIISLLPSATEWIFALGLGDRLVAISHECDYPDQVKSLPRVTRSRIDPSMTGGEIDAAVQEHSETRTSLYELDAKLIGDLKPDLILTQTLCDVCAVSESELMRAVTNLPDRCLVLDLRAQTFAGVIEDAKMIILATGNQPASAVRLAAIEKRIDSIRQSVAKNSPPIPRVSLLEWIDPLFSAGHWTPQLIQWAGGEDPIGMAGEPSRRIEPSRLLEADPQILLIACCGLDATRAESEMTRLMAIDGWQSLSCVKSGQVHLFDGSAWFNRPGPRLVEALQAVADLIKNWYRQR